MPSIPNQRMELFTLELFKGTTAGKAALIAGYSEGTAPSQGSRLLKNVKVQARLAELNAELTKRTGRDAQALSDVLWGIIEDKTIAPNDRVTAARLEARRFREYAERREFSGPGGGPIPLVGALLHGMITPTQADSLALLAAEIAARGAKE